MIELRQGATVIPLRNPEFGENNEYNITRTVNTNVQGGLWIGYNAGFPKDNIFSWRLTHILSTKKAQVEAFFIANLGKQIQIKDLDGVIIDALILEYEGPFEIVNEIICRYYEFNLRFIKIG